MAEAAEQLLAGTGWLPSLLRTERPAWLTEAQPEILAMAEDMTEADSAETVEDKPSAVAAFPSEKSRPRGFTARPEPQPANRSGTVSIIDIVAIKTQYRHIASGQGRQRQTAISRQGAGSWSR